MQDNGTHAPPPPPPPRPRAAGDEEMAAASKSLADALRVSFRLLSLIMIAALIWLLRSGMGTIQPEERVVRLTFGRIAGEGDGRVMGEGLRWSWPEPVGRFVRVSTKERTLRIDDLWLHETGQDAEEPLSDRRPRDQGLRPGYDGALMTGDRGLIHIRILCTFKTGVRRGDPDPDAVIDYIQNVKDTDETVRCAVSNAAIRAAAERTLDSIYLTARSEFASEVKDLAQKLLNQMGSGIHIQNIRIPDATVPLNAIDAFDEVTRARAEWEGQTSKAKEAAVGQLNRAAGSTIWPVLAGELEPTVGAAFEPGEPPAGAGGQDQAGEDLAKYDRQVSLFRDYLQALRSNDHAKLEALTRAIRRFGLMKLYAETRQRRDERLAGEVMDEIQRLLLSNRTTGLAAKAINDARSYSAGVRQKAKAAAQRFRNLLVQYRRSPKLMLERQWANVKTEILTNPEAEKFYLPAGQKLIVRFSGEPDIKRRIQRAAVKAKQEQQRGK